jgi:anaerobic magnesium-protoporphyrin IX monomethyl ester cyclase
MHSRNPNCQDRTVFYRQPNTPFHQEKTVRVLLINPFCPISENPTPPLGIAFLAGVLEEAGIDVRVLDLVITPYDPVRFRSQLNSFNPQIIGLTAVTMTIDNALEVIREVKKINPNILTIIGGPHVSFFASETLESCPELDLVVTGEGEETLLEITSVFDRPDRWPEIDGIAFRGPAGIQQTKPRAWLDVNKLPLPARHLLPLGRYRTLNTAISMTTSRGCPCRCIFCVGRRMVGAKVRYREPTKVVDELAYLSTLGFPQINIADDLFTAKKSHCLSICEEITHRQLNIKWSSFARVDTVSAEVLAAMRTAGCSTVSFGVESANAEMLKRIKKGITVEKAINAIQLCIEADIEPHVSFILGLPGETPETIEETLDFGRRIGAMGASYGFHLLAPFPGTAVRDENDRYDLRILTEDWSQYHANRAIVETSTVSRSMLDSIAESWERGVHEQLAAMQDRIQQGIASAHESWQIQNMERFLFLYDLMMKGIIEKEGCWRNGTTQPDVNQALEMLAAQIHQPMGKTRDETLELLVYAMKQQGLRLAHSGEWSRWEWKDFL